MTVVIDPRTAGISGNMVVGALVDIGANKKKVMKIMEETGSIFGDINVEITKTTKSGIKCTYVNVESNDYKKISYFELIDKLENLEISKRILKLAKSIFKEIALCEARIHNKSIKNIKFHNVGVTDIVADVFGAVYSYFSLGLDKEKIFGLPVALGTKTSYLTFELLKKIPTFEKSINNEISTPTGVALFKKMCDNFRKSLPLITIDKIGYGAGKHDLKVPNILKIFKGKMNYEEDNIALLETNIDHLSGEILGNIFETLINTGALDVSIIPCVMKKNRPGHILRVLCRPKDVDKISQKIFEETGTLGIRVFPHVHRYIIKRKKINLEIDVKGKRQANFKVSFLGSKILDARIEYEDAKRISKKTGLPLKDVMRIANEEFYRRYSNG